MPGGGCALTRPTKTGLPVLFWWHAPDPRLRSAAGQLLRQLLRLRQLADDRLAPRIPFRQPGQQCLQGGHGFGVIFITHRAQGQHLQHRQAVRLPLMQVTQQQLAHPNLTAISRPHQRAGVIESRRRVIRRQRMRPAKGADRRLAIV